MKNIVVTVKDWKRIRDIRNKLGYTHNSQVIELLFVAFDSLSNEKEDELIKKHHTLLKEKRKQKEKINWNI